MPRKTRFRRCSKGVSTVIGTIFLVLIALTVATNVFLWTFTQNATYNQAVKESSQMDAYRSSERIVASNTNYSIPQLGTIEVSVTVSNEGPISAQILTLWVLDENTKKYSFNDTLNINLNPGDTLPLTIRVAIPGVSSTGTFNGWLVTARGNLVPLESERGIIVAQLAQGIGSISMDFATFRYFTYNSTQKLNNYPEGIISFNILKGEYVAFGCNLTNLDPLKLTITLDSHSLFWQPGRPAVPEGAWFIVNVDVDGTINGIYSSISLNYGETKMIVFASQNDLALGSFSRLKTPNAVTTVATFLLLHGTLGVPAYAQNIPFVSIYYY